MSVREVTVVSVRAIAWMRFLGGGMFDDHQSQRGKRLSYVVIMIILTITFYITKGLVAKLCGSEAVLVVVMLSSCA